MTNSSPSMNLTNCHSKTFNRTGVKKRGVEAMISSGCPAGLNASLSELPDFGLSGTATRDYNLTCSPRFLFDENREISHPLACDWQPRRCLWRHRNLADLYA